MFSGCKIAFGYLILYLISINESIAKRLEMIRFKAIFSSFARYIFLGLGLIVAQIFADAGHSHGEPTAKQALVLNTAPNIRLMQTGKTFEIVLKVAIDAKEPELTAYIADPESNLPIIKATVTLPFGSQELSLTETDKKGIYQTKLHNISNGILSIVVKKEKFSETFTFENVVLPSTQSSSYLFLILLLLGATGLVLFRKKLKFLRRNNVPFLLIALIFTFDVSILSAHMGEDHGSKEKDKEENHEHATDSGLTNTTSGIIVPKELQLHLNMTTEKVIERSVKQTVRLIGHVISDPSGYARLQASQNARVLNDSEYPLPLPGQKIKKDQVILSIQPTLGKVETSEQKTALYKIESEIVKLRKEVERREKLGQYATKKDLENARAELEAVIKQKEEIINKTFKPEYLKAPLDGIISDLHVRPGEIVTPDKTIVEIVDPSQLMIEALLFDPTLGEEIVGGYARLPLNADQNIPLELLGISPKVNREDQAIHVLFKAKEIDPSIKLDMAIEVLAELKSSQAALTIPKSAIIEDRTGTWVFVKVNPETFEPRKIRVNRYVDQYAEITDGVSVGEVVVVNGAYLLYQAK